MTRTRILIVVVLVATMTAVAAWVWNRRHQPHAGPSASMASAMKNFTCPMHPEVTADRPGSCPSCGMDLQPAEPPRSDAGSAGSASAPAAAAGSPHADGAIAYYTCSMHPEVKRTGPGTCPICKMDLTAVTAGEFASGVVLVDDGRRRVIGVTTAVVASHPLMRRLRAPATIAVDQTTVVEVTVRSGGWIATLGADYVGKRVAKGDPLFALDSPDLVSAQGEFIATLASRDGVDGSRSVLAMAARAKLGRLGLTADQIDEIARTGTANERVPIVSPADATVVEKSIAVGARVDPGMRVLRLADLSRVWLEASLAEGDLAVVAIGQEVEISAGSSGAESARGTIAFIEPTIDPVTRTGRVRVVAANPDGRLKPGALAIIAIGVVLGDRLAVPEDAVVVSGEQRVVFRDLGAGKFEPVRVLTGARVGGLVEITKGLAAGDTIAATGVFLLASESRLKSGSGTW